MRKLPFSYLAATNIRIFFSKKWKMEVSHLFGNVLNFLGGAVPGHFVGNFV
jgi:hypothetical protein